MIEEKVRVTVECSEGFFLGPSSARGSLLCMDGAWMLYDGNMERIYNKCVNLMVHLYLYAPVFQYNFIVVERLKIYFMGVKSKFNPHKYIFNLSTIIKLY